MLRPNIAKRWISANHLFDVVPSSEATPYHPLWRSASLFAFLCRLLGLGSSCAGPPSNSIWLPSSAYPDWGDFFFPARQYRSSAQSYAFPQPRSSVHIYCRMRCSMLEMLRSSMRYHHLRDAYPHALRFVRCFKLYEHGESSLRTQRRHKRCKSMLQSYLRIDLSRNLHGIVQSSTVWWLHVGVKRWARHKIEEKFYLISPTQSHVTWSHSLIGFSSIGF